MINLLETADIVIRFSSNVDILIIVIIILPA